MCARTYVGVGCGMKCNMQTRSTADRQTKVAQSFN